MKTIKIENQTVGDKTSAGVKTSKTGASRKIYHLVTGSLYGIALAACFITNLAVERRLSWFFIVLFSIAIAFSITNLPFRFYLKSRALLQDPRG